MQSTTRIAIYTGIIGFILGLVAGVWITQLEWRWGEPWWYKQGGVESSLDGPPNEEVAHERREAFLGQFDLTNLTIDRDEMLPGGPPKDGIPSLTHPETAPTESATFLSADDRIVAITKNGESRAYPIRVLNHHEIINDTLGNVPIAVVYCPLCDSVSVVDRRVDGEELTFGVSGLLYQSNVLMYDRQHDALWSQILLEAVSGPFAGQALTHYGFEITEFDPWSRANPEATVVTLNTGHRRNYDANPYERYLEGEMLMFPVKRADDRLPGRTRVVGIRIGETSRAYPLEAFHAADDRRLTDTLGESPVVLEADAVTGQVRIIDAPADAQIIHTFWFAWAAVHPETEIYGNGAHVHN